MLLAANASNRPVDTTFRCSALAAPGTVRHDFALEVGRNRDRFRASYQPVPRELPEVSG